jgi:hypothetical protein
MATLEDLYEVVDELSLDELRDLNDYVVERMRAKRNAIQSEKMPRFSEGEAVKVVEDGEVKFTGTITQKKRTHVIIASCPLGDSSLGMRSKSGHRGRQTPNTRRDRTIL